MKRLCTARGEQRWKYSHIPVTARGRDQCYSRTEEQVRVLREEIPSDSLHLRLKPGTQIFPPTCKNGLKTTDSATSLLHFTEHGFRLCSQRQATILPTIYFYLITPSWLEMQEPVGKLQPTTFHE